MLEFIILEQASLNGGPQSGSGLSNSAIQTAVWPDRCLSVLPQLLAHLLAAAAIIIKENKIGGMAGLDRGLDLFS